MEINFSEKEAITAQFHDGSSNGLVGWTSYNSKEIISHNFIFRFADPSIMFIIAEKVQNTYSRLTFHYWGVSVKRIQNMNAFQNTLISPIKVIDSNTITVM